MNASTSRRTQWAQKVVQVQGERKPEEVKAAMRKVEAARQHEETSRKCKAVKGLVDRSRCLAVEGLKQMSAAAAPEEYMAIQERWQSAQQVSRARQEKKWSRLEKKSKKAKRRQKRNRSRSHSQDSSSSVGLPRSRSRSCDSNESREEVLRAASDSEEEAMEEAAQYVGASDVSAMAAIAAPRSRPVASSFDEQSESEEVASNSASDVDAEPLGLTNKASNTLVKDLLKQLVVEPPDAAECAAKFSLYEGYASEVENMRNTLLKFHEDSKPSLPQAVVTDMDKKIRNIDNAESMGILDDTRKWFVYHMMQQAERNNSKMAGTLDTFDKKLKFLAQSDQVECPVCLESFGEGEKAAETLGCCHKVCKECWQNWSKLSHGRPFCPLCRQEDFMGAVAERASRVHSDGDENSSDEE